MSDIQTMTVRELKKELKKYDLNQLGLKKELADRLQEYLNTNSSTSTTTTTTPPPPTPPPRKTRKSEKKQVESEEEEDGDMQDEAEKAVKGKRKVAASTSTSSPAKRTRGAKESKDEAKEEKGDGGWIQEGSIFVLNPPIKGNEKIAGFDMDDTLIETKTGKTFATSRNDWKWLFPNIPEKLKQLHESGVKVVIFTNQAGIKAGTSKFCSTKASQIKGKIIDLAKELGFPIQAFIAGADDQFRKPAPFLWKRMVEAYNDGIAPNVKESYYVGDAAGRVDGWEKGKKKDFACTDRKFAHNVDIAFHTPEEFFLGNPVCKKFEWGGVDISAVVSSPQAVADPNSLTEGGIASLTKTEQEMVVYVGFPASGKTTFTKRYMIPKGYFHVNKDTLKDQKKCVKATEEAVSRGESVAIDNTSPSAATRSDYIKIAKKAGIPVRCFRFDLTEDLAKHLNMFRERITNGDHKHVPGIAYSMYKKGLEEPKLSEGFQEIKKIKFVPIFESDNHRTEFERKA